VCQRRGAGTWNDGRTESFDVTFYKNGSVWFGPYGPYTPTCYGNKFLVVNSGDSFETFTFTKGYYEPNVNRGGTKR